MPILKLGTRKSALAQAQAHWAAQHLHRAFRDVTIDIVLISTSGDEPAKSPADAPPGGLKALFTKEIEDALLAERIDFAVHSLKDMAATLPAGLEIGAVPKREDPRDVWISPRKIKFANLPAKAKIGTSAVRRQAQLKHLRPDIEIVPLRGNVDTRLRKLESGEYDGIVLAAAGLKRLGREQDVTEIFPHDVMVPAIGQGALAIESRSHDLRLKGFLNALDHRPSHQAALAERSFLRGLGGSCQTPIAGYALSSGTRITLTGLVLGPSGQPYMRETEQGPVTEAEAIGERLAARMRAAGADKIIAGEAV